MGKSARFAIEIDTMAKSPKTTEIDDQGKLFIEAARELGCDEDPAHFDEILKKVARHKPPLDPKPEPKKLKPNKLAKKTGSKNGQHRG
jgi:hypothetical protein